MKLPPVDGVQQVTANSRISQLSAQGESGQAPANGQKLPGLKATGADDASQRRDQEVRKEPTPMGSGGGRVESRLRLALGMKGKKEEPAKLDFFKLAPNPVVEYARSEYVLHNYFQDYLSKKIDKQRFAGIRFDKGQRTSPDHLQGASVETAGGDGLESTSRQSKATPRDAKSQSKNVTTLEEEKQDMAAALRDPNQQQLYRGKMFDGHKSIAAFAALQRIQTGPEIIENKKILDVLGDKFIHQFGQATSVARTGRTTLFSTIVDNNERYDSLAERSKMSGVTHRIKGLSIDVSTPMKSLMPRGGKSVGSRKRGLGLRWDDRGTVSSSKHLEQFTSGFSASANQDQASNVYLPEDRRLFFRKKATLRREKLPSLTQNEIQKAIEDDPVAKQEEKQRKKSLKVRAALQVKNSFDVTLSQENVASVSVTDSPLKPKSRESGLRTKRPEVQKILEADESKIVMTPTSKVSSHKSSRKRNRTVAPTTETSVVIQIRHPQEITLYEPSHFEQSHEDQQPTKKDPAGIKTGIPSYRYKERRQSFNMCQTKFEDVRQMYHPLKKAEGPTLNDLATIRKMEEAKRYPIPESLLHQPFDFELTIDSLMHEAYNCDEKYGDADIPAPDLEAPCNSQESVEEIDFHSSSDEALEEDGTVLLASQEEYKNSPELVLKQKVKALKLVPILEALQQVPATRDELLYQTKMKNVKVHKEAMRMHGLDVKLMKVYPNGLAPGDVPSFLISMGTDVEDQENATKTIVKSIQSFVDNPMGEPPADTQPNATMREIGAIHTALEQEFQNGHLLPSWEHIQLIYEHYCEFFGTTVMDFFKNLQGGKLELTAYKINLAQAKAVACVLPLLKDLVELRLQDNGLSDEAAALLVLAAFLNPRLKKIGIEGSSNQPKQSTCKTIRALMNFYPTKLEGLSFRGVGELQNAVTYAITDLKQPEMTLQHLDLSHQPLSAITCQTVGRVLIHNGQMRTLDLQSCHIAGFAMTLIMDGLSRNFGLQSFNLANNSMSSVYHEHAIKMASVIVRHPDLMHVDISMTQLVKEELIFIGMALSQSTSMMALHMSGCGLEYYERVFLRTLIDAKCSAQFRKAAHSRMAKAYKPMDKKNLFFTKIQHEKFEDELEHFLAAFSHVEHLRLQNHDEAFEKLSGVKLIKEDEGSDAVDVVALFESIKRAKKKKATQDEQQRGAEARLILQDLITKLTTGGQLVGQESKEAQRIIQEKIKLGDDAILLADLRTMGLLKDGQSKSDMPLEPIKVEDKESATAEREPATINMQKEFDERFQLSNMLKIDRIRQRVEVDALKHLKSKSAGEIALMFQGIGKVAHDILHEQPMTGYMSEVVFTRMIGHEDIEDGHVWRDTSQCWICEKWSKHRLGFKPEFINNLKQDMQQMHELDKILEKCLDADNHDQLEHVNDITQATEECGRARRGTAESVTTATEDRIETESIVASEPAGSAIVDAASGQAVDFEGLRDQSEMDPINAVPFDRNRAERMLPKNHRVVKPIYRSQSNDSYGDDSESSDEYMDDIRRRKPAKRILDSQGASEGASHHFGMRTPAAVLGTFGGVTRSTFGNNTGPFGAGTVDEPPITEADEAMRAKLRISPRNKQSFSGYKAIGNQRFFDVNNLTGSLKKQKKKEKPPTRYQKDDGRWYRRVTKSIYWQGATHTFEEEERIPTDQEDVESESVSEPPETSEDDLEVDDELVQHQFADRILQKMQMRSKEEKANHEALSKLLKQNAPTSKSLFDRHQVYLCASFNDWVPVELRSLHELRLMRQKGDHLEEWVADCKRKKNGTGLRAVKEVNNQLLLSAFIPPGRHFFYFIQDRKHLCLSTDHDIVRYKGTSVFLNELKVQQRVGLPTAAKTARKVVRGMIENGVAVFCKPRSVFKTYQEDDEDFVKRMMRTDLKHSKIQRLIARQPNFERVLELLEANYKQLKNIFEYYISNSKSYPRLSLQDFQQYCYRTKLYCRNFTLAAMDKAFVATNASINGLKNQDERELNRYEFMELLIRIAQIKYQVPKIHPVLDNAFGK